MSWNIVFLMYGMIFFSSICIILKERMNAVKLMNEAVREEKGENDET